MTDNEIKKALECLEANTNCSDCALYDKKECKGECVFTNTLDLINRLQAEVERFKDEYEETKKRNQDLVCAIQIYKAEAYKEFAEKAIELIKTKAFNLKLMRSLYTSQSAKALERVAEDIDNLLKEMVGGSDE